MRLPTVVADILRRLHANGHRAFLVGGCVRDMLLLQEPKDWDVATSAPPPELIRLFPGAQLIGAHFGVILWSGVEIATFRSDGAYTDGRRPLSVHFEADPVKDAWRRDFTINGLFYDVEAGAVIDYVHGQEDIANRTIRAIGDPADRFAEDHLRMLRAVRFAARLGFAVEPQTAAAIQACSGEIGKVAPERVRDELSRILTGLTPRRGLELLDELRLLEQILPEVKAMQGVPQPPEFHPEGDVWTHTLLMLEALHQPSVTQVWGVLLHDVGKPQTITHTDRIRFHGHEHAGARMASEILHRLRYPNEVIDRVVELVDQHMKFLAVRTMRESTRMRFLRQPLMPELLELHRLDCQSSHGKMEAYDFCLEELRRVPPAIMSPARLLTGNDLIAWGVPRGPQIGQLLQELEDAQLEGTITTKEEALLLLSTKAIPGAES